MHVHTSTQQFFGPRQIEQSTQEPLIEKRCIHRLRTAVWL